MTSSGRTSEQADDTRPEPATNAAAADDRQTAVRRDDEAPAVRRDDEAPAVTSDLSQASPGEIDLVGLIEMMRSGNIPHEYAQEYQMPADDPTACSCCGRWNGALLWRAQRRNAAEERRGHALVR